MSIPEILGFILPFCFYLAFVTLAVAIGYESYKYLARRNKNSGAKKESQETMSIETEIKSIKTKFLVIGFLTTLSGIALFFSPLPPPPFNALIGLCIVGLGLYLMS